MKKNRSTKRALLMSALSMVLCLSMLVGSTFAWFTDSVTSKGNIIKSGTLDVEMYWADGTLAVPATDEGWTDASKGAIFKCSLWEPGYTEVRHIKIENKGTLALKYQLMIQANGEVSKLSDVIDVYYTDPAKPVADRTALANETPMGTLTEALIGLPNTAYGELTADEAHTITLALKMQESAGNEYQDLAIGSDFSIILMATQVTNESDSFGPEYDASAEIPEMDIKTINGVTYGVGADGNYYMISVEDPELKTFSVDNAVTVLGTGNGVNDNDRVFGKNAPLESLTLPEGLVEIKDNALNALPNLTKVNLPSTLKTIGIQSFRTTGMTELTVPDNVETIKDGAFRDMANLTTVTVEGNVAFENYAFRSCPNLTSIYLLGDDVTFTGSQFATRSDNGDATGLTIYVKNTTVAARVYAAQTSAHGYEVKVLGDAANGSDAVSVTQVKNATDLETALAAGDSAVLSGNVQMEAATTAPYGNKYAVKLDGGVLDGNGNELYMECYGDDYGIMTSGGTIKNLTIKEGCRAVMIMHPQSDIILDNVNIGGDGVLYPINTGEAGAEGVKLIVTNSTLAGWTSYGLIESASFTNVEFKQGTYYNNIYGRVLKPYVNTTLTNCSFVEHMNLDLSALANGHKVTMTNCTVNGQPVTAETFTVPTTDSQYDTELFTVDLPSWATSINDCIVFG